MNINELIQNIGSALETGRDNDAKEFYKKYITHYAARALISKLQLKIADLFYKNNEYVMAAEALERHFKFYPEEHRWLCLAKLGVIYAKHLRLYGAARKYLSLAIPCIGDSKVLEKVKSNLKRLEDYFAMTAVGELTGPCSIIKQTEDSVDIPLVGNTVAPIFGVPVAEITTILRCSKGILTMNVSPDKAEVATQVLKNQGIPVLIIPNNIMIGPPPELFVSGAAFNAEGGYFQEAKNFQAGKREPIFHPWSNIYMFVASDVGIREGDSSKPVGSQFIEAGVDGYHGDVHQDSGMYADVPLHREKPATIIDVLIYEPWARYRIVSSRFTYNLMKKYCAPDEPANLSTLCHQIIRYSQNIKVNQAVEEIANKKTLKDFQFRNDKEFDLYITWLLQLEEFAPSRLDTHQENYQ